MFDIEKLNRENFRVCLRALSNPGRIGRIEPLNDSPLLAMASLLLYPEVSHFFQGEADFQMVAALTGSKRVEKSQADYLFSDHLESNLLAAAKLGTAENPDLNASLVFSCPSLSGAEGMPVVLKGPGIKTSCEMRLPLERPFLETLQKTNCEFPFGVDLFFVDGHGRLLGIPRSIRVEERHELRCN